MILDGRERHFVGLTPNPMPCTATGDENKRDSIPTDMLYAYVFLSSRCGFADVQKNRAFKSLTLSLPHFF